LVKVNFLRKISAKKLKEASVIETNLSRSGAIDFSEKFEIRVIYKDLNVYLTKTRQLK